MSTRSIVALAAVASLVAGCQRPGSALRPGDLPRIVLQADEAPPGTRLSGLSGPRDLAEFARDDAEEQALRAEGFEAGYVAYFPPESYFLHRTGSTSDVAYQAIAALFERDSGASSALHRYADDLRTRQMSGATAAPSAGVGDEEFALSGDAAVDRSPLLVYAWRVRNLILVLAASGPVDGPDVVALVRTMSGRAG